jgi:NTE family protein
MTHDKKTHSSHVLVFQGGGALGSYQAGGYEALSQVGYYPDYVAGVSIGAINAALIAGNTPENATQRLREFWTHVSSSNPLGHLFAKALQSVVPREWLNAVSAGGVALAGIPGFFTPRMPPPFLYPPGSSQGLSFYDTAPLRETLLRLVDFDRINRREVRLAVGAVNVRTGNLVYFDNHRQDIGPEHIMASGALPPGFPPVEIDGEMYWDGGIVSNTPLQYVLDDHDPHADTVVFQFDLFSARGDVPRGIFDLESREKDIRFSSRTRYTTDRVAELLRLRNAFQRLYDKLPADLQKSRDTRLLMEAVHPGRMAIVHLIYRQASHELNSKDYEFSRLTAEDHWKTGIADVERTLAHRDWIERQSARDDLVIIDAAREFDLEESR